MEPLRLPLSLARFSAADFPRLPRDRGGSVHGRLPQCVQGGQHEWPGRGMGLFQPRSLPSSTSKSLSLRLEVRGVLGGRGQGSRVLGGLAVTSGVEVMGEMGQGVLVIGVGVPGGSASQGRPTPCLQLLWSPSLRPGTSSMHRSRSSICLPLSTMLSSLPSNTRGPALPALFW